MSDIIQLLPDHVANQIAAGEVVSRPASAVKELIENAIDAQATEIKLIVRDAGKTLVQVIDNGVGMSPTDARLAFERHATSKIRSAQDLFSLRTKGFRGEALASIAAIAQVELMTKQADAQTGTRIKIEGNKVISQEPCVMHTGTSILMKNLFFNIPARRNFLKSDNVELRHIIDEFQRVALAHTDVHFYFFSNDTEVFNLPATNLRQRIVHIFGNKYNEKLVPVSEQTEMVSVEGFVCKPSSKKNKTAQFFIVNQRFIKSRYLHHAVNSAFEGLLKDGEQPEYFLFLTLDPKTIDINIHPTKTEIKFEDEHTIYAVLRSVIKHSLGLFNVAPSIDFSLSQDLQTPYHYKDKEAQTPTFQVDSSFNPFKMEQSSSGKIASIKTFSKEKKTSPWESLYTDIPSRVNSFEQISEIEFPSKLPTLFDEDTALQTSSTILLFQRKYLVTHLKEKILFIHINRAHERILYEQFLKTISSGKSSSQQLLFPIELHFSPIEMNTITKLQDVLERAGFVFEIKSDTLSLTGTPIHIKESQAREVLQLLIDNELDELPHNDILQHELLAKHLAKSLAIRTGQSLPKEAQEQLIQDLFSCKEPYFSPFQKKIYTEISITDIDNKLN